MSTELKKTRLIGEKLCQDCGKAINDRAEICPKCGVRQPLATAHAIASNGKTKVAASLFGFFLGGLGAHKFYLGQTGMGVVYLLFCWTTIPALIALIESIIFLTMSDEIFVQKYGSN